MIMMTMTTLYVFLRKVYSNRTLLVALYNLSFKMLLLSLQRRYKYSDCADLISCGSLFKSRGAALLKVMSPR